MSDFRDVYIVTNSISYYDSQLNSMQGHRKGVGFGGGGRPFMEGIFVFLFIHFLY